jgi:hypothetical protein
MESQPIHDNLLCSQDPQHQWPGRRKKAFPGPFLRYFACSMVILKALAYGFFS